MAWFLPPYLIPAHSLTLFQTRHSLCFSNIRNSLMLVVLTQLVCLHSSLLCFFPWHFPSHHECFTLDTMFSWRHLLNFLSRVNNTQAWPIIISPGLILLIVFAIQSISHPDPMSISDIFAGYRNARRTRILSVLIALYTQS